MQSRKRTTKEALIEVGEQLLGQRGFYGVSLREIAAEAGQSNTNAVQYHFKDKEGLIYAIIEDRSAIIENTRRVQLAMFEEESQLSCHDLLKIFWLPLMTIQDADGYHSYCRFMLQYMLYPGFIRHPMAQAYNALVDAESQYVTPFPCSKRTTDLLLELHPILSTATFGTRISALARMFLASIVEHDNARAAGLTDAEFDIKPILDMAAAALAAPD